MNQNITTNSWKAWVLAARPKTLTGAATPVIIGLSLAYAHHAAAFNWVPAVLCILFAFAMQIDANLINDIYDYKKGTDRDDRLGPERACAQGWITTQAMTKGIAITTLLAALVGLPLIAYGGWEMIAVGALCIVFAFLYTMGLSYKGWGDVLVLVFFGLVPVGVTFYIQTHTITLGVLAAALACGLIIDTLLMVNNFRDREQDAISGKRTLVVKWGATVGQNLYLALGIVGYLLCFTFIHTNPYAVVLPLIYLVLHFNTWKQMVSIHQGKALNLILGKTARNIFMFGLLLSIGLLL